MPLRMSELVSPRRRKSALLVLVALTACIRAPTDDELRPPVISEAVIREMAAQAPHAVGRLPRQVADRTASYLRHAPPPRAAAPALARAIRYSAAQARTARQRNVPDHVREALEPYFGKAFLDDVRWVLPGRRISLGSFLAGWYFAEGAVTLDSVIVFSDDELAQNVWFWAHELGHVEQYHRLGYDGFAGAYVRDWRALEAEASARADRVTADIRRRQQADEAARVLQAAKSQNEGSGEAFVPQAPPTGAAGGSADR